MSEITAAELREKFVVRNGKLFRKEYQVGTLETDKRNGYQFRRVKIAGKSHKESRLIFLMIHGYLPKVVDHEDGDSLNNDPMNLREATHTQNGQNMKTRKDSTSQYRGVSKVTDSELWQTKVDGKYFGCFKCEHEAGMVAFMEREKSHKEFLSDR